MTVWYSACAPGDAEPANRQSSQASSARTTGAITSTSDDGDERE